MPEREGLIFVHPPSPMLEKQRMVPPLNQLQLAAILRQSGHKEVELWDVGDDDINPDRLLEKKHVLVTATTPQYPEALRIISPVLQEKRKHNSPFPILSVGGAHASYMGHKLLEDGWNNVCIGEGDRIIAPLVEGKINEGLIIGVRQESLDELPYPAYDLLNPDIYKRKDEGGTTYPIMTSLGCPYDCSFCYKKIMGKRVRYHSPEYTVGVVRQISGLGVNQVVAYDDTFTLKAERVVEICRGLETMGITWRCNAHVNTLVGSTSRREVMLKAMKDAGCGLISIGVDGVDTEALDYLEKGTTIAKCERAIEAVKKAGILAKIYLIYIPGRGITYVDKMREFINRTEPDMVQASVLIPMPGSRLYENPEKYGLHLEKESFESYYYCGKGGESGADEAGLLSEEDRRALNVLHSFLDGWRQGKPEMPI